MNNLIINFDDFEGPNEYNFLSNFYRGNSIVVFGRSWRTGEHAFAGMKAKGTYDRGMIRRAVSPGAAKSLGRAVKLRSDWEEIKYDVMMTILRNKFTLNRAEGRKLLLTGNAMLVEGTRWGDEVWGVNGVTTYSPGRNWLGTLLMARRAELVAITNGADDPYTEVSAEQWVEKHKFKDKGKVK